MTTADRCRTCDRVLTIERLTVPRAKTGDLVFCGWRCYRAWAGTNEQSREQGGGEG